MPLNTQINFDVVVATTQAQLGLVADDHSDHRSLKLAGIAALTLGDSVIPVALIKSKAFSLNRLYLKDGKVRVSREAVGGAVIPMNFNDDVKAAVDDYNDQVANSRMEVGSLQQIQYFSF